MVENLAANFVGRFAPTADCVLDNVLGQVVTGAKRSFLGAADGKGVPALPTELKLSYQSLASLRLLDPPFQPGILLDDRLLELARSLVLLGEIGLELNDVHLWAQSLRNSLPVFLEVDPGELLGILDLAEFLEQAQERQVSEMLLPFYALEHLLDGGPYRAGIARGPRVAKDGVQKTRVISAQCGDDEIRKGACSNPRRPLLRASPKVEAESCIDLGRAAVTPEELPG